MLKGSSSPQISKDFSRQAQAPGTDWDESLSVWIRTYSMGDDFQLVLQGILTLREFSGLHSTERPKLFPCYWLSVSGGALCYRSNKHWADTSQQLSNICLASDIIQSRWTCDSRNGGNLLFETFTLLRHKVNILVELFSIVSLFALEVLPLCTALWAYSTVVGDMNYKEQKRTFAYFF